MKKQGSALSDLAVQRATEILSRPAVVAILGAPSRTWFVDIPQIYETVWWLLECDALIRIGGKLPFDSYVECAVFEQGQDLERYGPVELEARLKLEERDAGMLEGCDLVVAFPTEDKDVISADPLVYYALTQEIPVLAVYRSHFAWYTSENYGFG